MKRFLPKSLKNPRGFTLIELLVVISIIAILSVIGVVIYTNVQKNARDTRRKGDIDAIANALESNKAVGGNYVLLANTQFTNGAIPSDPITANVYCANSTASNIPTDPATWTTACPNNYGTLGISNPPAGTAWKVCASLESGSVYCRTNSQ